MFSQLSKGPLLQSRGMMGGVEVSASFCLFTDYSAIINTCPHGSLGFKSIAVDMRDDISKARETG